eukprot:scaffold284120_cov28-Prasinocladus_malaysianus.AAC.1
MRRLLRAISASASFRLERVPTWSLRHACRPRIATSFISGRSVRRPRRLDGARASLLGYVFPLLDWGHPQGCVVPGLLAPLPSGLDVSNPNQMAPTPRLGFFTIVYLACLILTQPSHAHKCGCTYTTASDALDRVWTLDRCHMSAPRSSSSSSLPSDDIMSSAKSSTSTGLSRSASSVAHQAWLAVGYASSDDADQPMPAARTGVSCGLFQLTKTMYDDDFGNVCFWHSLE